MGGLDLAFGGVAALGVLVIFWSQLPPRPTNADEVEGRLLSYAGSRPRSFDELELQKPFGERIVRPLVRRAGQLLSRLTPEKSRQELQRKLNLAGRPLGLSAVEFLLLRYSATALGLAGSLPLGLLTGQPALTLLTAAGGALAGFILPVVWLGWLVGRQRREIQLGLPDALDLLVVSIEAGLGFEAAMDRVAERYHNAIGREFARTLKETKVGRPRLEALEDMGRRSQVEDLHNFVQVVIQSEQMGSAIVHILRTQADEIRRRRIQRAQELGATAPLKMLLPMVGCIFPTLWIILLGPAGLLLLDTMARKP